MWIKTQNNQSLYNSKHFECIFIDRHDNRTIMAKSTIGGRLIPLGTYSVDNAAYMLAKLLTELSSDGDCFSMPANEDVDPNEDDYIRW